VVVWLKAPLVPLMISGLVPVGVLLLVVILRFVLPLPVTVVGVKVALERDGKPVTLKLTVPLKPFDGVIVTRKVTLEP
jgi:hypothetical protein